MNSYAASSCTCSPKGSYAFAILVSWPIGDVPLSCHYAFTCLARHNNRRQIKMPLTHKEIAAFIGTTRETVTRTLSEFKSQHLVELHGSTLVIGDREALEEFVTV